MPAKKAPVKRATTKRNTIQKTAELPKATRTNVPYEIKLLLLAAFSILFMIFLYTGSAGIIGRWVRSLILGLFGFTGYFLPVIVFFFVLFMINPNFHRLRARMGFGFVFLTAGLLLFFGLIHLDAIQTISRTEGFFMASFVSGQKLDTAGLFGDVLTAGLTKAIGSAGHTVITVFSLLMGLFLISNVRLKEIREDLMLYAARKREKRSVKRMDESLRKEEILIDKPRPERSERTRMNDFSDDFFKGRTDVVVEPIIHDPKPYTGKPVTAPAEKADKIEAPTQEETKALEGDIKHNLAAKVNTYHKPNLNLLKQNFAPRGNREEQKKEILDTANKLELILRNFGVNSKVIEISRGPIINRFEIELEPGTKIAKVISLSEDLALNLAVSQVRVAAVPGKVAVGIEVPNAENAMVFLRDILGSKEFHEGDSKLKFGLGKDISGNPIVPDLSKMPHLLVAGTTGSGKSVCVNTIITSLLFNATPDEVKLLLIDPKVVELNVYNGIPHLILPVVTDPKKAAIALGWAVNEMTRRYELFAQASSREIDSYNAKHPEDKLPKIVIIIDELSDLMMVAPNQVEDAIARLAQMARAAGIHLIVATQRPSVDVITGLIKANIPSRISFAVSSSIDSRTILDMSGAEKLLGKGDMLYLPVGSNRPKRVQGCFISEGEIAAIVESIKNQDIAVAYDEAILDKPNASLNSEDFDDDLLEEAIRLVIEMRSASASMLQRKFRIGYNRAGRLIDMMEERGIVGPPQGSKPRDVIVDSYGTDDEDR